MTECAVAVVGGGISGLAAAWELARRGIGFHLFEAAPRFGGLIRTERVGPYLVDAGPDSLLVQKPAALDLCEEIGVLDRLIPIEPPRTAYVLRHGRLRALPTGGWLGLPGRYAQLWRMPLFSIRGRLRVALEPVWPARPPGPDGDESIAAFMRRRFGREAARYLGEPLLAGIHVGDPERLSVRALFPRLLELEREYGSVLRGLRRSGAGNGMTEGGFRSFPGGMAELVDALVARLPGEAVHAATGVTDLAGGPPYRLRLSTGHVVTARAVVLAVPAYVAAELLTRLDLTLAGLCAAIPYLSSATVVLAYARRAVRHPLEGVGFVVPRGERGLRLLAATWSSSKWPGRAPPEGVLLRAFFGGARDPAALAAPDEVLVEWAHHDLDQVLGLAERPLFARVYRWERASPQLEVGHVDRLGAIETQLRRWPGLVLTGAGYRAVGIPDCLADGRAAAARAAAAAHEPAAAH